MTGTLTLADVPPDTPLHAFIAWNLHQRRPDRRYQALHLIQGLSPEAAVEALAGVNSAARISAARVVSAFSAATRSPDRERQAALFQALDALEDHVDLAALPHHAPSRRAPGPKRILVIKLSALGDFIQALGPMAAIRAHHKADSVTLLTTGPFARFAQQTRLFDHIEIDRRPRALHVSSWLDLRRRLRRGQWDRVYDLQTSGRSSFYAHAWWPGSPPEWSGIARHCSHPHANLGRDPQHTIDKQAEQLLMAGIHPTPLPALPTTGGSLPDGLAGRPFALLIPGASLAHPAKRWPARHYGALAAALTRRGLLPVVVGTESEGVLAAEILRIAPASIDLTGRTDLMDLVALARSATVAVGNDTGASHIAAAAGRPLIVLFSAASEPRRCAPRGTSVTVLRQEPLSALPVGDVLAAVEAALRSTLEQA